MRCSTKSLIVIPLLLSITLNSFCENMPDPRYDLKDYTKWYYKHFTNSVGRVADFELNKPYLIAGSISLAISFLIDSRVQDFAVNNGLYSQSISRIGDLYGGGYGYAGAALFIPIYGIVKRQSFIKTFSQFQLAAESVITTSIITSVIKLITHRERPNRVDYKSFPSGHTSCSFALASSVYEIYGKKVGIPAYLIATLVGSSRINDNKHYLSDVVAGAILGTIVGRSFSDQYRVDCDIKSNESNVSINLFIEL